MIRYIISIYLFSAVLMTAFFATYVLSKSRAYYLRFFSALSLCASVYLFGYLLEINSSDLTQMIFWNQVQYFGVPFFPPLWFLVALSYSRRNDTIRLRYVILLLSVSVLTFIVRLTNSFHHLYYSSMKIQDAFGLPLLYLGKGPWYYVHNLYALISLIVTSVVLYRQYRINSDSNHRSRLQMLLLSSFVPYIGTLIILFDFGGLGIDYTAIMMPLSLVLLMQAFMKYDFLEVKTLARETIFENSLIGMLLLDKSCRVIDYNRAAEQFFSYLGIQLQNFNIESTDSKQLIDMFKSIELMEYKVSKGDDIRFFEIDSTVMTDSHGRNTGILKYIRDITEKKKIMQELHALASTDEMSGLNNRRNFFKLAQQEFERVKRYNQVFSLLMMDIDHFKSINDTYGHAAGDVVIQEIGRLMNGSFRKTDISGRIGGEEFAVVLTNTSADNALLAAEQFRRLAEETEIVYNGAGIRFTVSIGIACYSDGVQYLEELLKYADEALYEAKAAGRNRTVIKENP